MFIHIYYIKNIENIVSKFKLNWVTIYAILQPKTSIKSYMTFKNNNQILLKINYKMFKFKI